MEAIRLSLFLMLCLGVHRSSSETLKRQKRDWIIDSFSIDEGYKGTFPYDLGQIKIQKNFTIFRIHGQGVDMDPKGLLQIHPDDGVVTVHDPIDYEKFKVLKLTFQALDRETHIIDTQLGIELKVIDANDNPPVCDPESYNITLKESTLQGTEMIILQATDEDSNAVNGQLEFKIVSVTPQPQNDLQFSLFPNADTATMSFKGCLDHERTDKYTIVVVARDQGTVELSTSCVITVNIEDGNNHPPVISGQQGSGRVKEREENVLVKSLQVKDQDSKGTAAWRAKFTIQGDTNNNFMITTDPETNEGLLYVKKYLDYEDSHLKNLTISVENEVPYHMCQVMNRRPTGLWDVVTVGATEGPSTIQVIVNVEDVNEPPIFVSPYKQVTVDENVKVGHYLETFTARDHDSSNTVTYRTGDDPADWVTVDAETGNVTTSNTVDRESSFVNGSIYTTTIFAVDNGQPPMTGTATLEIHITDVNDNAPSLPVSAVDMCQDDGVSLAKVTAFDPDEKPFGGPFTFKLLGDVKGKWRFNPTQGYSVNLVKEKAVHSGHHNLLLEVFDLQGRKAIHNLSVTVCSCQDATRPNCHIRKAASSTLGGAWLAVFFFSMLLLAVVLLLAILVSCKNKSIEIQDGVSAQRLMDSNIEKPGTDCKVVFEPFGKGYSQYEEQAASINQQANDSTMELNFSRENSMRMSMGASTTMRTTYQLRSFMRGQANDSTMEQNFSRGNSRRRSMGALSTMTMTNQLRSSMRRTWAGHRRYSADQVCAVPSRADILKVLNMMLNNMETPSQELGDYAPHVYAEEGDTKTSVELDAISIPDVSFDPDMELDFKFNTLASLCMPEKSSTSSLKSPTGKE